MKSIEMSKETREKIAYLEIHSKYPAFIQKLKADRASFSSFVLGCKNKKLKLFNPLNQQKLIMSISIVEYIDNLIDYYYEETKKLEKGDKQ